MSFVNVIDVSAIIPTRNRHDVLHRTLYSLSLQAYQPKEVILIDASTKLITSNNFLDIPNLESEVIIRKANVLGAAAQRNQGISIASQPFILFMDDDILLEQDCLQLMWNCIFHCSNVGGVNAMIINQRYHSPSRLLRMFYFFMHGKMLKSYAGKCIGPAMNIMPEDDDSLPIFVQTEWLNTTCTLYNRMFLPNPVFDELFIGYSMMEDLTLSLRVGEKALLFNARTARIFHDSQIDGQKRNKRDMAKMELVNRHYIMAVVLKKIGFFDYCKLFILELFFLLSSAESRFSFLSWYGKFLAVREIMRRKFNKILCF